MTNAADQINAVLEAGKKVTVDAGRVKIPVTSKIAAAWAANGHKMFKIENGVLCVLRGGTKDAPRYEGLPTGTYRVFVG